MTLIPKNLQITKRVQIDKDQATTIGVVAAAVFISVFSLVSCKSLLSQRAYQQRVIAKQEKARDTLKQDLSSVEQLATSYKAFVGAPDNVIGGNPKGTGDRDGDNAKIVLDALPSKYDFPALASSLEKIMSDRKFKVSSITGSDDELRQANKQQSDNPTPIEIPFSVAISGSYQSAQDLIGVFEKSIRPLNINKISLSGSSGNMQLTLDSKTYYQPEKVFEVKTETVK